MLGGWWMESLSGCRLHQSQQDWRLSCPRSAWLLNLSILSRPLGAWLFSPDVQQMGFTNITPGCTGFHSSSLSLCHFFLWVQLSVVHKLLFCGTLKEISFFLTSPLHLPLLPLCCDSPLFWDVCWNWTKHREGERFSVLDLGKAFCHSSLLDKHPCSTWNAFGFTLRTAAIFLPLITSGLGALARHVPRPMNDPQGKSNGNQPSLTLLRFFLGTTLRERIGQQSNSVCVCVPEARKQLSC